VIPETLAGEGREGSFRKDGVREGWRKRGGGGGGGGEKCGGRDGGEKMSEDTLSSNAVLKMSTGFLFPRVCQPLSLQQL